MDGAGDTPDLSGVSRRNRLYYFGRPRPAPQAPVSDALQNLVLQPPTDTWPDSGPALNYLGATDKRLAATLDPPPGRNP